MRWDLDTITFNTGVADANGSLWYVTDVEGWDSAPLRQSIVPVTSRHGGQLAESMLDPRGVVLKGVCKATTEDNFWAAQAALSAATYLDETVLLKGYEGSTTKRLNVFKAGSPRYSFIGKNSFTFEYPLIATDPLKYGDTLVSHSIAAAGTASVTNSGNFDTFAVITATSAGTLIVALATTGDTLTTGAQAVAIGAEADMANRTLYEGATNRYTYLDPSSVWWALPPGTHTIQNNGTAAITFAYRPAWQ